MTRSFTSRYITAAFGALVLVACLVSVPPAGLADDGATGEAASGAGSPVIGPGLRITLSRLQGRSGGGTMAKQAPAPLNILIRADIEHMDSLTGWITETGGLVKSVSGDIVAASVPTNRIAALSRRPGVLYVSRSAVTKPLLTIAVPEIQADHVHDPQLGELPKGYQGTGVIIGTIDSGIDFEHDDFVNEDGTSRILYIWDQEDNRGPFPTGQTFGTEYTQSQITAALNPLTGGVYQHDTDGHGTHVTGCAAASGRAAGGFTGTAPKADIIVVKTDFDTTSVIAGVDYIFGKAEALGRPCVVNLSLGTHEGAHDGTDEFTAAINNHAGPGKIIVAAAGNEYQDDIHLGYTADVTERYTEMYFYAGESECYVDIWYDPPGELDFKLEAYDNGHALVGDTGWVVPGWSEENIQIQGGGTFYGSMDLDATEIQNIDNSARHVVVSATGSKIGLNYIYFKLYSRIHTGSVATRFDAWNEYGYFGTSPDGAVYGGDGEMTVGLPACGSKIIAVANYVTRKQWTSYLGTQYTVPGENSVGDIAKSSSRGPSRNVVLTGYKPEIAAPGTYIGATLSEDALLYGGISSTDRSQDGEHVYFYGTSMSSPVAAGALALLLQKKSSLTPEEVDTLITQNAYVDAPVTHSAYGGSAPNYTWGYGKLDILSAMQDITAQDPGLPTGLIVLTATPSSLLSNGTSEATVVSDTIVDVNQNTIADGEKFNVEITVGSGEVRAVGEEDDAYATTAEVEISSGSIAFVFRAGIVPGNTMITVDSQNGDAAGTVTIPLTTSSGSGADSPGGGGCFIATAAYDTRFDEKIDTLRVFRDSFLLKTPGGRDLIYAYYAWGPHAAAIINRHPETKPAVRLLLEPLVTGTQFIRFLDLP